ncbi:PAS domain S-box protein, partial [bacterium]
MQKEKILIVEDERIVSIDLKYILTNLGYDVVGLTSKGYEAIEYTLNNKVDAILMDIGLRGDIDGIETAIQIKKNIDIPIVFVTANSDESTLQRSKEAKPQGYILKPFNDREIRTTLEMAIFKHNIDLKMKESEEWLFTTLKSIGDAVIATDKDGNVKFMNHIAENLTGWTQEEAKGKQLNEVFVIVNEYTRDTVENPVEKVFREGKIVGLANHTILISRDNKEYHIDDAAAPIKNRQDIIDGVVLTFRDITDKKEIENQLSETQIRFSLFMDNSPTVSWIKDPKDWGFMYINKRFRDVFKLDNESVKGLTDFDIWDKKTAEQFRKNDIKVFKENKSVVTYEYEYTKNGEFKKWLSFKFPVKLPSGEILIGGTALDITSNDILEDKLK